MKKSLSMKFMLLLFALVVGCSNVWADVVVPTPESGTFIIDFYDDQTLSSTSGTGLTSSNYLDFVGVATGLTKSDVVTGVSVTGTVRYGMNGGLTAGTSTAAGANSHYVTFSIGSDYAVTKCTVYATAYESGRWLLNGNAAGSGSLGSKGAELSTITSPLVWDNLNGITTLTFKKDNGSSGNQKRLTIYRIVCEYSTGGGSTYSVTYHANGGTGSNFVDNNSGDGYASGATVTVVTNEGGSGHPNFTKTGYSVIYWSDKADWEDPEANLYDPTDDDENSFEITGNTDLYAVWNINKYTVALPSIDGVTLSATYGTSSSITVGGSAQIDYNTEITVGATGLAAGKAFVWDVYKTGESSTKVTVTNNKFNVPAFNVTISGNIVNLYTVTYDCNGGTSGCPSDVTDIASGTAITLAAAPTKSGYIFNGWYDGTNTYAAGASYTVTGNKTLTAQWTAGVIGTIHFGTAEGYVNIKDNSSGDDNLSNTWSRSVAGTTSYTATTDYVQIGSSSSPATSITFTTTLPYSVNIASFSAKFGGFSGTAGTVTLKVGNTSVGSGSLNATSDVTVSSTSTATGTVLTVTVTGISKGVKCYYISYTFTSNNPIIFAKNTVNLESTDTDNSFDYDVFFPVDGKSLSAATTTDWISEVSVDAVNKKITFTTTENTSTTDDRSGSITLSYYNATDKVVTIKQSKVDYVNVPFTYTGNASGTITGFTKDGIGTYSDAGTPIKFASQGNYLTIKFKTAPASISYDVKLNGNWNEDNSFDVMTSNDGIEWTTVKSHTTMTETTTTFTCLNLGRYVKWIYTIRKGGNVGLGNIRARVEYDIYGTASVASLAPTSEKKCTIYDGGVLTVTSLTDGTAANLVINDGGQLITTTGASVSATVKKNVTTWSASPVAGWLAISSPVDGFNFTEGGNFIPASGNYTMYAYDEKNCMWINSQSGGTTGFSTFNKGQGYLYRKTNNIAVEIAGDLVTSNFNYLLSFAGDGSTKGFNLIGNPYTHNIYKGTGTAIPNTYLKNGFYYLTSAGGFTLGTDNDDPIAPGQSVLVQATEANNLVFTNTPSDGSAKANHDKITFKVANSQYEDVTCAMFDKGEGLNKINHRNEDIPMIYIPQNGKNYALAMFSDFTEAFELSFKAATTGVYTLSYTTKGEFNYLHVIDRLTGADVDMLLDGEYKFIGTPSDIENRFIVRLAYMPDYSGGNNNIFAFQSGSEIYVSGEGELQIFDVTGRFVMSERINGATSISADALSKGVYVLRIVGSEIKTQKIVVR